MLDSALATKKLPVVNLYWPWLVGVAAVFAYILPWMLAGESGYIRIHDTLDSNLVWYKIMTEQKFWFAPNLSEVGSIFEKGVPRVSYPSELSVVALLFAWLEPYWAYVANQFILRLVAFSGMYIFLRSNLPVGQRSHIFIALGVALCYAALPYWAFGGGAVAGLAWIFYALIRVWRGHLGIAEVIILFVYPFYSHIVLTGMFLIGLSWLLIPVALIFGHRLRPILIATIITTISHLLVSYRLVEYAVMGGFISQRADYVMPHNSLAIAWSETLRIFQYGEWAVTLHGSVIFYTVLVVLAFTLLLFVARHILWHQAERSMLNRAKDTWWQSQSSALGFMVATCFAMALFCGLWNWNPITTWRETMPILVMVNFTRISFYMPFLWMVAFALALAIIVNKIQFIGFILIAGLLIAQLRVELPQHEYFVEKKQTGITYAQFFSKPLFDDIANSLPGNRLSYVVGSIGIHPSVAQYNGFKTADAFLALYPKEYKVKFRKVVVDEFSLRPDLLKYFDEWGSSAYFYITEMWCPRDGAVCTKTKLIPPVPVRFDVLAMRDLLGVKYLFSVPTISNAADLGLTYMGTFESSESAWHITVYRLPG